MNSNTYMYESIKYHSFFGTQLNDQTVPLLTSLRNISNLLELSLNSKKVIFDL